MVVGTGELGFVSDHCLRTHSRNLCGDPRSPAYPTAGRNAAWAKPAPSSPGVRERPTLLIRGGLRPGGLAPVDGLTRFTWTLSREER
jgi:hypothetical protein